MIVLFSSDNPTAFFTSLPPLGRIVGLDVGTKTVGVAVSDKGRMLASPVCTISRKKFSLDVAALFKHTADFHPVGWLVGLPLLLDGTYSPQTQRCVSFAEELSRHHPAPVLLWDERFSTTVVERFLTETADLSRGRRTELVDKLAACYFLQAALDAAVPR